MSRPVRSGRRRLLQAAAGIPFAAPSLAAAQPGAPAQKVLRYAFEIAESGFDPVQLSDIYSRIVTAHIFECLYGYDHLARPFKIKPVTAAAMPEVSEDFRTWTVRLRPGIYFQDDPAFKGQRRELVAEDYVYSLKRFFDPRWKAPAYGSASQQGFLGLIELREAALKNKQPFDYDRPVDGVRALDRYTLQFRFAEPRPRFIQVIAGGDLFGAVAREVVEAYGDAIVGHPVGTGPFRLAEWRRSSLIVLERNLEYRPHFYDAEPNADDAEGQAMLARFSGRRLPMIDRVEISIIDENQPRWLSFLNGQQDLLWLLPFDFADQAVPNGRLAPALQRENVRLHRALASDVAQTFFNMEDPVVGGYTPAKVALRRAICLATDIDQEIRLFWRSQAVRAHSALLPNTTGYDPAFRGEMGTYDLSRAKALLDTFGYVDRDGDGWREQPDGSPLTLVVASIPDQRTRLRDELRRKDMAALGIRVEFRTAQWPENLKAARAGKLMMWNLGASAASPDGQPALDRGATVHAGGQNLARFSNATFDRIYAQMRALPDGPERDRLFYEAKRILNAYAPYKFHVHRILTDLSRPALTGFRRPPYWLAWWPYVDVDPAIQSRTGA